MSTVKGMPTTDEYVRAFLSAMRAPVKEKVVSTVAGTMRTRHSGERILYGPNGEAIRVIEQPDGNTQVEHGDHLHAVVRPQPIIIHARGGN